VLRISETALRVVRWEWSIRSSPIMDGDTQAIYVPLKIICNVEIILEVKLPISGERFASCKLCF
jgi:hypothetical protein